MHYFVTIIYNVTTGNTINLLAMAIRISFNSDFKTDFQMSEGRLNVPGKTVFIVYQTYLCNWKQF